MINFVNLDGGVLGKPSDATLYSFPLDAIKVAYVLKGLAETLKEHNFENNKPVYGFQLPSDKENLIKKLMLDIEKLLPSNVCWYEVGGKNLFELRSISGGVASSLACYLIAMDTKK